MQIFIQVEELSTLAFPSHPHALPGVEDAVTVQQQEGSGVARFVAAIEFIDQMQGEIDERVAVVLMRLRGGVRKIGEQGEVEVGIQIREEADSMSSRSPRTCFSFSSRVGTATSVAHSSGMPSLKSSLGRACAGKMR